MLKEALAENRDYMLTSRLTTTWETCRPGVLDALSKLENLPIEVPLSETIELAFLHLYVIFTNAKRIEHLIPSTIDYFCQKNRYDSFLERHPEICRYLHSIT